MDLHYSQTGNWDLAAEALFYYLMDLHYSQTYCGRAYALCGFYYLMDLHYSQTFAQPVHRWLCFTTLWIYTILKLLH